MWITLGIYTIALQVGILRIVETQEFDNPEDCFKQAFMVMQDDTDPRGMACVPILKDAQET
jgi:hypothetical protein